MVRALDFLELGLECPLLQTTCLGSRTSSLVYTEVRELVDTWIVHLGSLWLYTVREREGKRDSGEGWRQSVQVNADKNEDGLTRGATVTKSAKSCDVGGHGPRYYVTIECQIQ
jgi:hypothetical protein